MDSVQTYDSYINIESLQNYISYLLSKLLYEYFKNTGRQWQLTATRFSTVCLVAAPKHGALHLHGRRRINILHFCISFCFWRSVARDSDDADGTRAMDYHNWNE